jgi:hypothetical protein
MKKAILLFMISFLISCGNKKSSPKQVLLKDVEIETNDSRNHRTSKTKENIHVINLTNNSFFEEIDKIIIEKNKVIFEKDSSKTVYFKINFLKKDLLKYSYSYVSKRDFQSDGSEWSGDNEFMSNQSKTKNDYRFIKLGYGYPACGYGQKNFLFFVDTNNFQLVAQWDSGFDVPYSADNEFFPTFNENKVINFYSKFVSAGPDETAENNVAFGEDYKEDIANNSINKQKGEDNEIYLFEFSDSTTYIFKNKKWKTKLQTPKGKVYKSIKKTTKEYYSNY